MPLQFPTTYEINHIVRNRVDTGNFIGKTFCPVVNVYSKDIEYDVLYPSFGITHAHQIGTDPLTVQMPKMETKRSGTAYWKETYRINEERLLYARAAGSYTQRAGPIFWLKQLYNLIPAWKPVWNGCAGSLLLTVP